MKSHNEIKILIVDDSRYFLELHGTYLRRSCCSVLQAANGNDAINMAGKEKPAVIIMDLEMPRMRGDEWCREIRSNPEIQDIPIIMVTSGWSKVNKEKCTCDGCDDVITKPVNRTRLLSSSHDPKTFIPIIERRYIRVDYDADINYSLDGRNFEGKLCNISEAGAFIHEETNLPAGSLINLSFNLQNISKPIEVICIVKWSLDCTGNSKAGFVKGMGVELTNIQDQSKDKIKNFIKLNREFMTPYDLCEKS